MSLFSAHQTNKKNTLFLRKNHHGFVTLLHFLPARKGRKITKRTGTTHEAQSWLLAHSELMKENRDMRHRQHVPTTNKGW